MSLVVIVTVVAYLILWRWEHLVLCKRIENPIVPQKKARFDLFKGIESIFCIASLRIDNEISPLLLLSVRFSGQPCQNLSTGPHQQLLHFDFCLVVEISR
eukprot:TRINITY_DN14606_c0_g1_i1.p1 TRINITY_DN14606_c0_g1~~TRINITY_DN14606_c0_g1_i1.p1  ORF type:complete len:100 (+),score=9.06 TRINITY_DN14606_c0_g1_i1:210-509(+)